MVNILTFFLHLAHSEQIFVACPSILILTNCIPEVYLDQLHYVENGNKVLFVVDVAGVGLFVWLQAVSTGGSLAQLTFMELGLFSRRPLMMALTFCDTGLSSSGSAY